MTVNAAIHLAKIPAAKSFEDGPRPTTTALMHSSKWYNSGSAAFDASHLRSIPGRSADSVARILERWTNILTRGIERVMERQQRVVLEKASGAKSKKALMHGTLDIDSVLSIETWNKQFEEDIKPVISSIINDSFESRVNEASEKGIKVKAMPAIRCAGNG